MKISQRMIQAADWKCVYTYVGATTSFKTFACAAIPGLTITHDKVGSRPTKKTYSVNGRKTDSVITAIRWYNAEASGQEQGELGKRPVAGSPESIKATRGGTSIRQ